MQFNIGTTQWELGSLYHHLQQLEDKRKARGRRYALAEVLLLVALGKLCGENETRGIAAWVQLRQAELRHALDWQRATFPHASTYGRVLATAVDVAAFETVIAQFLHLQVTPDEAYALDGKSLRGTIEPGKTRGKHLLSVYAVSSGVTVAQTNVERKENELSAAPDLLDGVALAGRVVTGDAMFTHHKLSTQIRKAEGNYLWMVKENQKQLYQAVEQLFAPEVCVAGHSPLKTDFAVATTVEKRHGRLERRRLTNSCLLNGYCEWEGLEQVFKLERHTVLLKSGKQRQQVTYGITSLTPVQANATRLLSLVRQHWQIENGSHYPRDVTLGEDACQVRSGQTQHVLAIINNLVLGLARQQPFRYLPDARRFYAAHPVAALTLFLKARTLQ